MDVREAGADDVPGIVEAYLRSWRAAYADALDPHALDEQAERRRHRHDWAGVVADPDATVVVGVDDDGRIRGVVHAEAATVVMLYVDPDAWGTGLAAQLLAAGERGIAGRGHAVARLRVVEDHHRARRFYEREGWTLDPDHPPERTELATLVPYWKPLGG